VVLNGALRVFQCHFSSRSCTRSGNTEQFILFTYLYLTLKPVLTIVWPRVGYPFPSCSPDSSNRPQMHLSMLWHISATAKRVDGKYERKLSISQRATEHGRPAQFNRHSCFGAGPALVARCYVSSYYGKIMREFPT